MLANQSRGGNGINHALCLKGLSPWSRHQSCGCLLNICYAPNIRLVIFLGTYQVCMKESLCFRKHSTLLERPMSVVNFMLYNCCIHLVRSHFFTVLLLITILIACYVFSWSTEPESLKVGAAICVLMSPPSDPDAHSSFKNTDLYKGLGCNWCFQKGQDDQLEWFW